jgi:hypothetical protein
MKKIKLTLGAITALVLPFVVSAQMEGTAPGGYPTSVTSLGDVIHAVENATGLVFGAIAVIAFVVAGILFLTAGGAPEKIASARSAFLWGIAGVVVGIIAFSIIAIVGSMLGGSVSL